MTPDAGNCRAVGMGASPVDHVPAAVAFPDAMKSPNPNKIAAIAVEILLVECFIAASSRLRAINTGIHIGIFCPGWRNDFIALN
jgi:hypothetical protein